MALGTVFDDTGLGVFPTANSVRELAGQDVRRGAGRG